MKYFKALNDHSFYSQKGELVYCVIKDELVTAKELKRILSPFNFNLKVICKKYFTKLSINKNYTHFCFGVRIEDQAWLNLNI